MFSGDAPTSLLTVSTAPAARTARPAAALPFMASPYGFTRALVLTVGEMVKELHQARRQRRRDVEPRVTRGRRRTWRCAAVTNVLLRDLNVSLIAEQMAAARPAIYCDFVDYDEVAHHAGPTRPESLQPLEGSTGCSACCDRLAEAPPRAYQIVVLSDHGQSQGATFRQRYGETLDRRRRRAGGRAGRAGGGRPAGPRTGDR